MIREIFGKKLGMTQIFTGEGDVIGVSVVEIDPVCILEKIDYPAKSVVKIGCFPVQEDKIKKLQKPVLGYFTKLGIAPHKLIREVSAEKGTDFSFLKPQDKSEQKSDQNAEQSTEAKPEITRNVGIEIFKEGEIVDVRGTMKGRGFAGGVKRHGWAGGPESHGSMTHRRIGSAGSNTYPGRKLPGLGMPGQMGNCPRTTRNLKIVKIDKEKHLLFIEGAVPGYRGAVVSVKKTGKKQ